MPSALIVCTRLGSQDLIVHSRNSHDVSIVKEHEVVSTLSKLDLARQEWRERVKEDLSSYDREVLSSGCRDREDREVLSSRHGDRVFLCQESPSGNDDVPTTTNPNDHDSTTTTSDDHDSQRLRPNEHDDQESPSGHDHDDHHDDHAEHDEPTTTTTIFVHAQCEQHMSSIPVPANTHPVGTARSLPEVSLSPPPHRQARIAGIKTGFNGVMTRAGNLRERHTSWGVSWGDSLSQTWQSETKVSSAGKQPPASSLASIARDFHDVAPQLVVGFPEQYLMVYPSL